MLVGFAASSRTLRHTPQILYKLVGKHFMKIVNANNLRVEQLGKNKYLTWTSTIYFSFVPKVIFNLDENGKVRNTEIVGFIKSLVLNFLFVFGFFLIFLYIKNMEFSSIMDFIPLFIGVLILLIVMNFIIIGTTKRIVKKQIE
jgi:hypothetical protein